MKRAIERYAGAFAAIVATAVVAIVCAVYILSQERLASPFARSYTVKAQFDDLTAVAPGLGEPVNVAGVRVGQISGVELKDGKAVASLRIDPGKLRHVFRDAHATLIPNTPLKDMRISLAPGTPRAGVLATGQMILSRNTRTPLDFDELLASLDDDTRTWLTGLIADLDTGTRGRGRDLRAILRSLGPTSRQLRDVGDLLAARRRTLPKLVDDLRTLSDAAGTKDRELGTVLRTGNTTLGALAGQDRALRAALAKLPGTLAAADDTLDHTRAFTGQLNPTLKALEPTTRRLRENLRDTRQLFTGGALLPAKTLRGFVAAAQPLTTVIPPTVSDLGRQTPALVRAFGVLRTITNELAYDSGGADQGFLYWTSWFVHNANSIFSTQDANGAMVRGQLMVGCSSLFDGGPVATLLSTLLGGKSPCTAGQGSGR